MAAVKATVIVMPKRTVLDPQGDAVRDAIHHHGLPAVRAARIGKLIELDIDPGLSRAEAERRLDELCRDLLSNPVIEDYRLELADDAGTR